MKEKILFWTPRILALMAILFMVMFSIDCFEGSYTLKEQLICFGMHNIPAFILIVILLVAWSWELVGGILFLLAFVGVSLFFRVFTGNPWALIVLLPFVITGILFILHHILYKKQSN